MRVQVYDKSMMECVEGFIFDRLIEFVWVCVRVNDPATVYNTYMGQNRRENKHRLPIKWLHCLPSGQIE